MIEAEARAWMIANVPRETFGRLEGFIAALTQENRRQNLVAASTMNMLWLRHIADSAQLLAMAPATGSWWDIGTGAGFPGLVIALISDRETNLVEMRPRRADFLMRMIEELGVASRVRVFAQKVQTLAIAHSAAVISARAFAPLEQLLAAASPLATLDTTWVLPKGRSAAQELDRAHASWQGEFRLVPSITDPAAAIIVARQVSPRRRPR